MLVEYNFCPGCGRKLEKNYAIGASFVIPIDATWEIDRIHLAVCQQCRRSFPVPVVFPNIEEGITMEVRNAKIEHTSLGFDHGIFTFNIHCEYSGGSSQGCGSIALSEHRLRRPAGTEILSELLSVVGVSYWEKLPGTPIRVRLENQMIVAVGHYMDDRWINFAEFCKPYNEEKGL